MKRIHGRKGQSTEFVEYISEKKYHPRFVAQKCGEVWNIFRNYPGKKGECRVLATGYKTLRGAAARAEREAKAYGAI